MRVLFSSTWGHGHIFPMVPLARAFLALGHEVRWATSGDSSALVAEAGIAAVPAGMPASVIGALVTRTHAEMTGVRPEDRAGFVFPRMFGAAATPAMLADLLPIAREWQPRSDRSVPDRPGTRPWADMAWRFLQAGHAGSTPGTRDREQRAPPAGRHPNGAPVGRPA